VAGTLRLATLVAVIVAVAGGAARSGDAAGRLCTASETHRVAAAFVRAWNRGDAAVLTSIVAPEPHFRWVSAGPPGIRSGSQAFDRSSLGRFIRTRHSRGDHLTLTRFTFNGSDRRGSEVFGHFEFEAVRAADDWPADTEAVRHGKGAIICSLDRPMLAVWSLG
jgi:hypothetical protein